MSIKINMKKIYIFCIFFVVKSTLFAQILGWQFGTPASLGNEVTYTATTTNANLNTSALSRGSGVNASLYGRAFSSTNFPVSGTKADAITNNRFFSFTVNALSGFQASLSTLNVRLRRSSSGPNAFIWRYSIDGTTFTDIGTDISFTNSTVDGVDQAQIDLSVLPALQNVSNATTITFRLYAWGATATTGTFAIGRYAAGITTNSFTGCVRGFSGVTDYHQDLNHGELVFTTSTAAEHQSNSSVQNLSSLFLKEFYKKLKSTFTPGLESIKFVDQIDAGNFIKRAKDFYASKGTDEAIKILFKVIFGETPSIINLEDYLIKPSSANYVRREVAIAEVISGEPSKIVGQTLIKTTDENTTASISAIEPFSRKGKTFHKIEFYIGNTENSSSVVGNFEITPK